MKRFYVLMILLINSLLSYKVLSVGGYTYRVQNQTDDTIKVYLYRPKRTVLEGYEPGDRKTDYSGYNALVWGINEEPEDRHSIKYKTLRPGEVLTYKSLPIASLEKSCLGAVRILGPAPITVETWEGKEEVRHYQQELIDGATLSFYGKWIVIESTSRCYSKNWKVVKPDGKNYDLQTLEGDITVTHYYPSKKAKTVQVSGKKALSYEQTMQAIKKSKLFNQKKNKLFDVNVPHSIHLGKMVLPKGSKYDLGKTVLRGNESPLYVEKKLSVPKLDKLMDTDRFILDPTDPNKFPKVEIEAYKKENEIIITSKTHDGIMKKHRLIIHKFVTYLQDRFPDSISKTDNYLFYLGYPTLVKLNLQIDNKGVLVNSLEMLMVRQEFWQVTHGEFSKPEKDGKETFDRKQLLKNGILKESG